MQMRVFEINVCAYVYVCVRTCARVCVCVCVCVNMVILHRWVHGSVMSWRTKLNYFNKRNKPVLNLTFVSKIIEKVLPFRLNKYLINDSLNESLQSHIKVVT